MVKSILSIILLSLLTSMAVADEAKWELVKDESGVQVYTRDFKDSKFVEFKGEMVVEASLSSLVAMLLDTNHMADWMHRAVEVRLLDTVSESERTAYISYDFAPIPDRDMVVRNKMTQNPKTKVVNYSMELLDHPYLEESGVSHIEELTGFVSAEPVGDGKIKIVFQAHIEPGAWILVFDMGGLITNSIIEDIPFYTLKNAAEWVKKDEYQQARFDFIQEPTLATNAVDEAAVVAKAQKGE